MMKRKLIGSLLILFILSVVLSSHVWAVGIQPVDPPFPILPEYSSESAQERLERLQHFREKLQERKETIQQRLETHRATVSSGMTARRMDVIKKFFNRMTKRIEAAINRLNRLVARIESRIAKIETENEDIDTTEVKTSLDSAKDKLASASAALADAQTNLDHVLFSENPKEAFTSIRNLIKEIKYALIDVHRSLVHLIGDIRGLRVGTTQTTTPAPTTPAGEGD